jgi:hypothetical protein
LAFALADSPTGLASWIVGKFYFWSDHGNDLLRTFPPDMLIDNLMISWTMGRIGSSTRYYYDSRHFRPQTSGKRSCQCTDRHLHVAQRFGDCTQSVGRALL